MWREITRFIMMGSTKRDVGMAGLNFVGNAVYQEVSDNRENVAQYEFIPWILTQSASVKEARELLGKMNLVGTPFNEKLPSAGLHWIIADKDEAITVECMADGLHVYDNPVGVLTNNPPFETADVSAQQLHESIGKTAGKSFFVRNFR